MKKHNLYLLFIIGLLFSACENLPDEQFVKQVIIAKNGFQELKLEYTNESKVISDLTISVSGTSVLPHDLKATVKLDPDTLAKYNTEKYRKDSVLFYDLLPDSCYSITNGGEVTIRSGEEFAVLPVEFNMGKIDPYKNYVLPLAIASVSDFAIGEPKYSKVLLHLMLSNSFSQVYQPQDAKVWWSASQNDDYLSWKTNFTLLAVNYNTCRLYAGGIDESNKKRDDYVIEITAREDNGLDYKAKNPAIQLQPQDNDNSIEVVVIPDLLIKTKSTVITSIKMNYRYKDISNPGDPQDRWFKGTLSNTTVVYEK